MALFVLITNYLYRNKYIYPCLVYLMGVHKRHKALCFIDCYDSQIGECIDSFLTTKSSITTGTAESTCRPVCLDRDRGSINMGGARAHSLGHGHAILDIASIYRVGEGVLR